MKSVILSSVFAIFTAGAAVSEPLNLVCDLNVTGTRGSGSFLASPIVLLIKESRRSAEVIDGLILSVKKKAVPGKVRNTAKGLRVNWQLSDIPIRGGGNIRISYSATLEPTTNRIIVRGRIPSAVNNINGVGKCRQLTRAEVESGNFIGR